MNKFLSSELSANGVEAEKVAEQIGDRRERAFVMFFLGQATFAVGRAGYAPSSPVDLRYVVEIARLGYQKKKTLDEILHGDIENVEWPDALNPSQHGA